MMNFIPPNKNSTGPSSNIYYDVQDQVIEKDFTLQRIISFLMFLIFLLSSIVVFISSVSVSVNFFTITLAFLFSVGLGSLFYVIPCLEFYYIKYSNKLPHEMIESFLEWEGGDFIKMEHFAGEYSGVTEDNKIIFDSSGYVCSGKNKMKGKSSRFYCLSPTYVGRYFIVNDDLNKRRIDQNDENLRSQTEKENYYEEFVKSYKNEKKKLKNKKHV